MSNKENKQCDYWIKHTQTYAHICTLISLWNKNHVLQIPATQQRCHLRYVLTNYDNTIWKTDNTVTAQTPHYSAFCYPAPQHSQLLPRHSPMLPSRHVKQDMGSQVQLWSPTWERGQRWLTNHLCTLAGGAANPLVKSNVKDAFTQTGWASLTDMPQRRCSPLAQKSFAISWAAAEMKNSSLWRRVWPVLSHTKTSTVKDTSWQAVPEL